MAITMTEKDKIMKVILKELENIPAEEYMQSVLYKALIDLRAKKFETAGTETLIPLYFSEKELIYLLEKVGVL